MDKCTRFFAYITFGFVWCTFAGVHGTVRHPLLNSFFGGVEEAKSRYFAQPQHQYGPPPFRILPTIINIKDGRVRLNYGYNSQLRARVPAPSSYSLADWIPIPRKPGPPSLPISYGFKSRRPPPPSGSGWEPPSKGWEPPTKGWAPKKKNVIYVLLKEPDVKTNVEVIEDGQKNEPEVILQYEGLGNHAQTHYEINKPTSQTPTLLLEQGPEPVPIPLPLPSPSPYPSHESLPPPESGGYIIQNQNHEQHQQEQLIQFEQPVSSLPVNNAAHNILSGYSGYSLNSLNTNGLPVSLVFKRMPEFQPEPATASTNERVEVSISSVTKQVSSAPAASTSS